MKKTYMSSNFRFQDFRNELTNFKDTTAVSELDKEIEKKVLAEQSANLGSFLSQIETGILWTAVDRPVWEIKRDKWSFACKAALTLKEIKDLLAEFERVVRTEALRPKYQLERANFQRMIQNAKNAQELGKALFDLETSMFSNFFDNGWNRETWHNNLENFCQNCMKMTKEARSSMVEPELAKTLARFLKRLETGINWSGVKADVWRARRDSWVLDCEQPSSLGIFKNLLQEFEGVMLPTALDPGYVKGRKDWVANLQKAKTVQEIAKCLLGFENAISTTVLSDIYAKQARPDWRQQVSKLTT